MKTSLEIGVMMATQSGSFVETKDLVKQFFGSKLVPLLALRNLNLTVEENEICSIMGPSGCGKSTLLNVLGGIDFPTSGYARVGSYYITPPDFSWSRLRSPPHTEYRRATVGFIFQLHNLSPIHTAQENVELPMIFAGIPREARIKKSKGLIEDVGLAGRAAHRPDSLSGGERQRVAVAVAFANDPKLVLADEPTGELDEENSKKICDLFVHMRGIREFTMVLVTHNPQVARIGKRILQMRDGTIKGEIDPQKLESARISSEGSMQKEPEVHRFPPRFCSNCGSNAITTPRMQGRSGIWVESPSERTEFELQFAQCNGCGNVFWDPKRIDISNKGAQLGQARS